MGPVKNLLIVVLCPLVIGCSDRLSRSQAAELITRQPFFKSSRNMDLYPGERCLPAGESANTTDFELFILRGAPEIGIAMRQRLLDVASSRYIAPKAPSGQLPGVCEQAGERFAAAERGEPGSEATTAAGLAYWYWRQKISARAAQAGVDPGGETVKVAVPTFLEVARLSRDVNEMVDVEFRWRWTPTRIAATFGIPPEFPEPVTGFARFRPDVGGWRLQDFHERTFPGVNH
jgi:hypothetical protein